MSSKYSGKGVTQEHEHQEAEVIGGHIRRGLPQEICFVLVFIAITQIN